MIIIDNKRGVFMNPINDEFSQCMQKLRITSNEIIKKRRDEIRSCNHLFVKLREGKEIYGCHSTDYYKRVCEVECVHCGLTNKFIKIEELLDSEYLMFSKSFIGMIPSLTSYSKKTLESQMFEEIFKNSYTRGGKSFNESDINFISEECLPSCHPRILYNLAIQISPLASNEKLFKIMEELHLLETTQEKIRLQTIEQALPLLNRYYFTRPKNLILKR